jgi:hypothetical protein
MGYKPCGSMGLVVFWRGEMLGIERTIKERCFYEVYKPIDRSTAR